MMKYFKTIVIPLSMYFMLIGLSVLSSDNELLSKFFTYISFGLLVMSLVLGIYFNIIAKKTRVYDSKEMLLSNMIIKIVEIPGYLYVFFVGMLGTLFMQFAIAVWMLCFLFDAICIFLSGLYATACIRKTYYENKITKRETITFSVLSYIFVVDVVVAILLYFRVKGEKNYEI